MLDKIYEDKNIIVYEDKKGYDFLYDIENKNDDKITIKCNVFGDGEKIEIIDWVGVFPNRAYIVNDILEGNYEVIK